MFQESQIQILQNIDGAKKASGLVVAIDVFRAFTTACFIMINNADRIITVGDLDEAYQQKKKNPEFILIGERNGVIQQGFNYGNSPSQIKNIDFTGKTIVFTTSAGTQGISNANQADEIITGAFVNIDSIINYIKKTNPANISLVCTGSANEHIEDEDTLCGKYIKNALLGRENNFEDIRSHLINQGFAKHFFNEEVKSHPKEDFDLCMDINRFDFVLKVVNSNGEYIELKKVS